MRWVYSVMQCLVLTIAAGLAGSLAADLFARHDPATV